MATYERKLGRADGIRWAINFVHQRAKEMNDPGARAALDVVANDMGCFLRDSEVQLHGPLSSGERT